MKYLADFVANLQSKGRYTFTLVDAKKMLNSSDLAIKRSLQRLAQKKGIALVHRGFYVVIPLEYRERGILPPEWFIDDLMKFLGLSYYVGLSTAAAIHGAAHQQPQEFHVLVPRSLRDIQIGNLRIRFFKKANLAATAVVQTKTTTGYIPVSEPAGTAIDLVAYARRLGGLSRVVSILQELAERIEPTALVRAAKGEKSLAPVRRLGYLLEKIGHTECIPDLAAWLSSKHPFPTPLQPGEPKKASKRDPNWGVLINIDVEGDL